MHRLPAQIGYLGKSKSPMNAVFPLTLSDFEYYMFLDDRPSHPMVFVMVVDVGGLLHEIAFQQSVQELLQSHPLLNCRIEKLADTVACTRKERKKKSVERGGKKDAKTRIKS